MQVAASYDGGPIAVAFVRVMHGFYLERANIRVCMFVMSTACARACARVCARAVRDVWCVGFWYPFNTVRTYVHDTRVLPPSE